MVKTALKKRLPRSVYLDLRNAFKVSRFFFHTLKITFAARKRLDDVCGDRLLLHLGCGNVCHAGWINVDIRPPDGGYFADFRNPIPLPDGCARHIHCEHVLEHLDYEDAISFLGECHRVLERGGSLRLILPDAEKYLRAYGSDDTPFFDQFKHLGGAVHPLNLKMEVINQMFRMGGAHRFAWDFETIRHHLERIGFADIHKSSFGDVVAEFKIDGIDPWREQESVYVNASKINRSSNIN